MGKNKFYREFSIADIFETVKRNIIVLILVPLLCAFAAYAYASFVAVPMYTSSASLLITKGVESELDSTATWNNNVYSEVLAVHELTDIYTLILTSESMMKEIKNDLELDVSVAELMSAVSITPVKDSGLNVNVTMTDPVLAQEVAASIVEHANSEVSIKIGIGAVVELSSPTVPVKPSSPRTMMLTVSGFLLAFIGLFIIVVLAAYLDDKIKDEDDFVNLFGLPVLGMIPKHDFDK